MLPIIQGKLEVGSLINDQIVAIWHAYTEGHVFVLIGSTGFGLASVSLVFRTERLCMWTKNITNLCL